MEKLDPVERMLPQNVDAEAALLASFLIDPELLTKVPWLEPHMFYRSAHAEVFRAMRRVYVSMLSEIGPAVDLVTVCDELSRTGQLDNIGGAAFVSSLTNHVPSSLNYANYAAIVQRTHLSRQVLHAAGKLAGMAYADLEPEDLKRRVNGAVQEALWTPEARKTRSTKDVAMQVFLEVQAVVAGEPNPLLPTGFLDIDSVIGGGKPGELMVIGGRPGDGKTSLALGMATHMAQHEKRVAQDSQRFGGTYHPGTILYATLEMRAESQVERLIAQDGQLSSQEIRRGFVDEHGHIDKLGYETFGLSTQHVIDEFYPILQWYDDLLNVTELEELILGLQQEEEVKVVFVDQLDLLDSLDPSRHQIEFERVSEAIRSLKQMARRLNILVVCLCQLNRDAAVGGRPKMSWFRMTGRIEQDSDIAMILRHPAGDDPEASDDPHFEQYAEIWFVKVRSGNRAGQMRPLQWTGPLSAFGDWPTTWNLEQIKMDLALGEKRVGRKAEPARPRYSEED